MKITAAERASELLTANIRRLKDRFKVIGKEASTYTVVFQVAHPYGEANRQFAHSFHPLQVDRQITFLDVLRDLSYNGAGYYYADCDIDTFVIEEQCTLDSWKVSKIVEAFEKCKKAHNFLSANIKNLDYELLRDWLGEQSD